MKELINTIIAAYAAAEEALVIDFAVLDNCTEDFIHDYVFMMYCREDEYKDFVYDYQAACFEMLLEN